MAYEESFSIEGLPSHQYYPIYLKYLAIEEEKRAKEREKTANNQKAKAKAFEEATRLQKLGLVIQLHRILSQEVKSKYSPSSKNISPNQSTTYTKTQ